MTFGYDICTYLQENHSAWDNSTVPNGFSLNVDQLNTPGSASAGTLDVLYLNRVPDDRTDCICVYDTGGSSPDHTYESRSVLDRPAAQIRIRNKYLKVAAETSAAIFALMDEVCFTDINGHYYLRINGTSPPTYTGRDQITTNATAYEFTLNLNSMRER